MSSSDVEMKGGHPPAGGVLQHSQRYGVQLRGEQQTLHGPRFRNVSYHHAHMLRSPLHPQQIKFLHIRLSISCVLSCVHNAELLMSRA